MSDGEAKPVRPRPGASSHTSVPDTVLAHAMDALERWDEGEAPADLPLPERHGPIVTNLLATAFRQQAAVDWWIERLAPRPGLRQGLRHLLRLTLTQLAFMQGIPAAATDTAVRDFLGTFSAMAKKYGIYLVASGPLGKFKETTDKKTVAALRDPDRKNVRSVYVATRKDVYNTALVWGPKDVRRSGPAPMRNVVQQNDKVPLTGIEIAQGFTAGPVTGAAAAANLKPYRLPGTKARLGIATSLPAFQFGDPPAGVDPCSDTAAYYMRCLDKLGANLVVQDEANPGRWAATYEVSDNSNPWQPLDWMGSGYRNVADPSVRFDYNVTAFMVGSLADLTFDGQSSITQRGLKGPGCTYVGNATAQPGDVPDAGHPVGPQPEFLALAPWVTADAPRADLEAIGRKLAPGSGDPLENDYLETALVADLPFPPNPNRPGCVTRTPPAL